MHTSHNHRGSTDDGREPHAKALRWEGADWPRSPEERRGWEMSRPLTGTQHRKEHSKSLTSLRPTAFEALHSPEAGAESTEHGLAARALEGRSFTLTSLSFTWQGLTRSRPSRGHWTPVTCVPRSQSWGADMNSQSRGRDAGLPGARGGPDGLSSASLFQLWPSCLRCVDEACPQKYSVWGGVNSLSLGVYTDWAAGL